MNKNVENAIQRTQAYWYVDGLYELGSGIFAIVVGIFLVIEGSLPAGSSIASTMSFLRNVALIGGTIITGLLVRVIKTRVTYQRTGYIAYPRPNGKKFGLYLAIGLAVAALVSCGLVFGIMVIPALQTMIIYLPFWLMVGLGIFTGGMLLSWGLRTGLSRFYWLAGLVLITGLVLALPGRGLTLVDGNRYLLTGPGIFCVVTGIGLSISGAITLRNYLNHTSLQNGEIS